jgi:hypothetical protein
MSLGDFFRGMCGLPPQSHYDTKLEYANRAVEDAYRNHRNAELRAISENPPFPLWMWKGVEMVHDEHGATRLVDKSVYDRCTSQTRADLTKANGEYHQAEFERARARGLDTW